MKKMIKPIIYLLSIICLVIAWMIWIPVMLDIEKVDQTMITSGSLFVASLLLVGMASLIKEDKK